MTSDKRWTVALGDLVVAAFDRAARLSSEPREVSRLATEAVERLLGPEYRLEPRRGPPRGAAARARRLPVQMGRH